MKSWPARALAIVGTTAIVAVGLAIPGPGAGARSAQFAQALCRPTIINGAVHYCGPASASLSVFPGVTFRHGTCRSQLVGGKPLFTLKMGVRTQNAATNRGLRYFGLSISGPFSHPTGGGVIAYSGGKRWGGPGVSFRGSASGGSFIARGINGSRGTANGRYHC